MKIIFQRCRFMTLLLAFLVSLQAWSEDTSSIRTINVATAGQLSSLLPQDERSYVQKLTITGNLNGTDFNVIRPMCTDMNLQILDLSGANIVSGGESYFTNYSTDYYTKDNELGASLFDGCKKLETITLPNSITTIGQCAFWYCTNLKTMIIGSEVTDIRPGLWGHCDMLTDVQLLNNQNFHLENGILYDKNYTKIIAAMLTYNYGDLTIRSGVKEIQYNAFSECSKLTSVKFPSSVTTIGTTAFEYTGITSVTFTSNITSIGSFAFSGNKNLKEVDLRPLPLTTLEYGLFMTSKLEVVYLPKNLTNLEQSVFSSTPLRHIFVYGDTPPSLYDFGSSSPTFNGVETTTCVLHVPTGTVDLYKAATGWKEFSNIVENQDKEAYAALSDEGKTVTFYYDTQKASRSGVVEINNKSLNYNETNAYGTATTAVFDASFADQPALLIGSIDVPT